MFAFALSAALLPLPAVEAELLLRKMDRTITAAKSLRVEYELKSEKQSGLFTQVLVLDDRNRFRMEGGWAGHDDLFTIVVGDGKRAAEVSHYNRAPEFHPIPAKPIESLRAWLPSCGAYMAVNEAQRPEFKPPPPPGGPRVSHVRLLPDEEVDGVKCRVVGYRLDWRTFLGGGELGDIHVRVWIDPKTGLPVRREMRFEMGRSVMPHGRIAVPQTWTETVKRFDVNLKLDDALFELPTEADLLLAQMDAKIRSARALRIDFEMSGTTTNSYYPKRGSLILADRNRFRFEWTDVGGRPDLTLGNGRRSVRTVKSLLEPRIVTDSRPQAEWHNDVLRSWLGRGGTMLSAMFMGSLQLDAAKTADGRPPDPGAGPVASKARLLPDEAVNGVKARVVEYDLSWRNWDLVNITDPSGPMKVRVWIDPKTKLPLRRSIGDGPDAPTATHTRFELEPKLDDRLFELPK